MGIFYYIFSHFGLHNDYSQMSQLKVIAIFTAIFMAYFVVKKISYHVVGWVFFNAKKMTNGLRPGSSSQP